MARRRLLFAGPDLRVPQQLGRSSRRDWKIPSPQLAQSARTPSESNHTPPSRTKRGGSCLDRRFPEDRCIQLRLPVRKIPDHPGWNSIDPTSEPNETWSTRLRSTRARLYFCRTIWRSTGCSRTCHCPTCRWTDTLTLLQELVPDPSRKNSRSTNSHCHCRKRTGRLLFPQCPGSDRSP